ncbi:MAG: hypothetical protein ACRC41_15190, partial [Sarcina sp.]
MEKYFNSKIHKYILWLQIIYLIYISIGLMLNLVFRMTFYTTYLIGTPVVLTLILDRLIILKSSKKLFST